jgi:hypothetical protein
MATPPYDITGSVKLISDVQTFPSGFTKREFVVQTEDDYPQPLKFECVKEKCAQLDRLAANDRVRVLFRIRGNAGKDGLRYFVSLQAYQVDKIEADGSSVAATGDDAPPPAADDPMPF